MATGFGGSGCTLLVWIDNESWRLENMDSNQKEDKKKELLEDAIILLSGRWNMESTIMESNGIVYGFLVCPRFVVGIPTVIRALGDLGGHVHIHRGGPTDSGKQLIRYVECKKRYNVPDVVSEGSSGDVDQTSGYQSSWGKRTKKS
uniref:Uncharacterized protein n=1 Tax=Wood duck chaphamaparvovirus TaxID=2759604 RepID=A0A7D6WTQ2_9VIRU|nr:hypothetical protein [Wood duck chaphamaparvovirus]